MATQLRATPPAIARWRAPVSSWAWRAILSTISSVTAWIDAARSISRRVISLSGRRGGPPKSSSILGLVMTSVWQNPK